MNEKNWEVLTLVSGSLKAEILRGFLEAQGIDVVLSQEGIGESIYPLTVGPLSEIEILVASSKLAEAKEILADYEAGAFERPSDNELDVDQEGSEGPGQG